MACKLYLNKTAYKIKFKFLLFILLLKSAYAIINPKRNLQINYVKPSN